MGVWALGGGWWLMDKEHILKGKARKFAGPTKKQYIDPPGSKQEKIRFGFRAFKTKMKKCGLTRMIKGKCRCIDSLGRQQPTPA